MAKSIKFKIGNKWKVCRGGYEIREIGHPDGGTLLTGSYTERVIKPKTSEWREYELPPCEKALWSFLGYQKGRRDNLEKAKFLPVEELIEWTNEYGPLWFDITIEEFQKEQRIMVAVYNLLEDFSNLDERGKRYYIDCVLLPEMNNLPPSEVNNLPTSEERKRYQIIHDLTDELRKYMAIERLLKDRLNMGFRIKPSIDISNDKEGASNYYLGIVFENSLRSSLWISLINALSETDVLYEKCIFCGGSSIISSIYGNNNLTQIGELLKPPSTNGIKGYYHQRCRNRVWKDGQRHPEKQKELTEKYGIRWDIRKKR